MIVLSVFLDQLAVCHGDSLFWDRGHLGNCIALLCLISKAVIQFHMDLSSVKKNFAVITNIVKDSYISRKESQVARWLNGGLSIKILILWTFFSIL